MIKSFSEIPEPVRFCLEKYFSDAEKNQSRETFVYMLRMFWQARYDKMNSASKNSFDWISQNILPADVDYKGIQINTNLISLDVDHTQLAFDIFESLYALKNPVIVPEKQSFFKKLRTFIGGKTE